VAPLRAIDPTGLYHVFSRGNYRSTIFFDETDYQKYLSLLARVSLRRGWNLLDWCLLPNHFHLVVRLENGELSSGMRELNGCYSRWSNRRTGRTGTGHLVKNRFGCIDVIRDGHLWELMSYVPLNPVRAGLVDRPEDWPWSGYRATIGLEHPRAFHRPNHLLQFLGKRRSKALERYLGLVEEARVRIVPAEWSDQAGGAA
jgi:putative transposase